MRPPLQGPVAVSPLPCSIIPQSSYAPSVLFGTQLEGTCMRSQSQKETKTPSCVPHQLCTRVIVNRIHVALVTTIPEGEYVAVKTSRARFPGLSPSSIFQPLGESTFSFVKQGDTMASLRRYL